MRARRLVAVIAIAGAATAGGNAAAATGCFSENSDMRMARMVDSIDNAQVQIDRARVGLFKALLASDGAAGDRAAVRGDRRHLTNARRGLAGDLREAAVDHGRLMHSRAMLSRCMATRR